MTPTSNESTIAPPLTTSMTTSMVSPSHSNINNDSKSNNDLKSKKRKFFKKQQEKNKPEVKKAMAFERVKEAKAKAELVAAEKEKNLSTLKEYLIQFKCARSEWKFQKIKQILLIKYLLKPSVVDDETFELALFYLENLAGKAKDNLIENCHEWMEKYQESVQKQEQQQKQQEQEKEDVQKGRKESAQEDKINDDEKKDRSDSSHPAVLEFSYKRAKKLLKLWKIPYKKD